MDKYIMSRLEALEAKIQAKDDERGPEDLFGRYYDELPPSDRWRWWKYMYCNYMPFKRLEDYERYELAHTVESLHFQCFNIPDLMDFTALDDMQIEFSRRDYLGGH